MQEVIIPIVTSFFTALITWMFSKRKTQAEGRAAEIETEVKAAEFYKSLLDDAMARLDRAIATINKQEDRINELIAEVESLTEELRKYKQLNGKQNENR